MNDSILVFIIAIGVFLILHVYFKNMKKRDKEKTRKFFEYLKTEEGEKKAGEAIKAFDTLRHINRNIKAGRPTLHGLTDDFQDTKPNLDDRIDAIVKKNRETR